MNNKNNESLSFWSVPVSDALFFHWFSMMIDVGFDLWWIDAGLQDGVLDDGEVWIGTLLLRHLQLVQFNAHEIQELVLNPGTSLRHAKNHYIGVGVYPTAAYLNHSCLPDVSRFSNSFFWLRNLIESFDWWSMNGCCRCFVGTSLVLRSSRTIACGQSVSENYGPLFTHKSQTDRQTSLKGRYWFQCRCQPCTSRWPMYDGQFKISFIFSFNQFNCLYLVKSILMYMFFFAELWGFKVSWKSERWAQFLGVSASSNTAFTALDSNNYCRVIQVQVLLLCRYDIPYQINAIIFGLNCLSNLCWSFKVSWKPDNWA